MESTRARFGPRMSYEPYTGHRAPKTGSGPQKAQFKAVDLYRDAR